MRVLGIMSGTSLDGIDFALCNINSQKVELLQKASVGFTPALRKRLRSAATDGATTYELGRLHHDLGRYYASAASRSFKPGLIELAGLHGQTVFHDGKSKERSTLQIGEPAHLASALGCRVISNFRAADIAVGGHGAPLAPALHQRLFSQKQKLVVVLNLGGIANVTFLDWRESPIKVTAFDTGPANMLIDLAVARMSKGKQSFDREGAWAKKGKINRPLLRYLLKHPFYRKKPPKSTGREEFGEFYFNKISTLARKNSVSSLDVISTLTQLTCETVGTAVENFGNPSDLICCGGGAFNLSLLQRLSERLPRVNVLTCEELGWKPQLIEPAAFAYLSWLYVQGKPGNIPSVTGARKSAILGVQSLP